MCIWVTLPLSLYAVTTPPAALVTDPCLHLMLHMALVVFGSSWPGMRMGSEECQSPGEGSVYFQSLSSLTASCLTGWSDLG